MRKNTKDFLYRLFFTRSDDLDLLQIFFLLVIVFFLVSFGLAGAGVWNITPEAWDVFVNIFYVLAIVGVPTSLVTLIVRAIQIRFEAQNRRRRGWGDDDDRFGFGLSSDERDLRRELLEEEHSDES